MFLVDLVSAVLCELPVYSLSFQFVSFSVFWTCGLFIDLCFQFSVFLPFLASSMIWTHAASFMRIYFHSNLLNCAKMFCTLQFGPDPFHLVFLLHKQHHQSSHLTFGNITATLKSSILAGLIFCLNHGSRLCRVFVAAA